MNQYLRQIVTKSLKQNKGIKKSYERLKDKMEAYEIMQRIAKEYRSMIELIDSEKNYFRVDGMTYRARSDSRKFEINSRYAPISPEIIKKGLQSALDELEKKILSYREELKAWL